MMNPSLQAFCCFPNQTIREVMTCLSQSGKGIVLIIDQDSKLLFTVTDGDIRRAILAGHDLENPASILPHYKSDQYRTPTTAPTDANPATLLQLMNEHTVNQIPLLDSDGRVVKLVTRDEISPQELFPIQAVIMAGGFGKRLFPLTENLPKPMLPIGDRPIMEHIVTHLQAAGIRNVNVTTHFQPEKIEAHFGDGSRFGVNINYVNEEFPLGTAGSLSLLAPPTETMLVINGDILTQVDFKAMLHYHREHHADFTIGVRQYGMQLPYGVVETDAQRVRVTKIQEKPVMKFFINAGIYLLEPEVYRYIPHRTRFDMTDLIEALVADNRIVVSFPIVEYWLDIGQHPDYNRAQQDYTEGNMQP